MDFLAGILKGIIQIFGPTIGRWLLAAAKWIGKALLAVLIFIFDLLVKIGKFIIAFAQVHPVLFVVIVVLLIIVVLLYLKYEYW